MNMPRLVFAGLSKSLGSAGGLKVIAIGPQGGQIVGYLHGDLKKPIYAGSAAAKYVAKTLKKDAGHMGVAELTDMLAHFGATVLGGHTLDGSTYATVEASTQSALHHAAGAAGAALQSVKKVGSTWQGTIKTGHVPAHAKANGNLIGHTPGGVKPKGWPEDVPPPGSFITKTQEGHTYLLGVGVAADGVTPKFFVRAPAHSPLYTYKPAPSGKKGEYVGTAIVSDKPQVMSFPTISAAASAMYGVNAEGLQKQVNGKTFWGAKGDDKVTGDGSSAHDAHVDTAASDMPALDTLVSEDDTPAAPAPTTPAAPKASGWAAWKVAHPHATQGEVLAWLQGEPVGAQVHTAQWTYTKNASGTWSNPALPAGSGVSSGNLATASAQFEDAPPGQPAAKPAAPAIKDLTPVPPTLEEWADDVPADAAQTYKVEWLQNAPEGAVVVTKNHGKPPIAWTSTDGGQTWTTATAASLVTLPAQELAAKHDLHAAGGDDLAGKLGSMTPAPTPAPAPAAPAPAVAPSGWAAWKLAHPGIGPAGPANEIDAAALPKGAFSVIAAKTGGVAVSGVIVAHPKAPGVTFDVDHVFNDKFMVKHQTGPWGAYAEHAGSRLFDLVMPGHAVVSTAVASEGYEYAVKDGSSMLTIQPMVPNGGSVTAMIGSKTDPDFSALTPTMQAEILASGVGNWLVSDHDAHADQYLVVDGHIVRIDFGQCFKHAFTSSGDKLDLDYDPNGNKGYYGHSLPMLMLQQIKAGKLPKSLLAAPEVKAAIAHALSISDAQLESAAAGYAGLNPGGKSAASIFAALKDRRDGIAAAFSALYSGVAGHSVVFSAAPAPVTTPAPIVPDFGSIPGEPDYVPPAAAKGPSVGELDGMPTGTVLLEPDEDNPEAPAEWTKLANGKWQAGHDPAFVVASSDLFEMGGGALQVSSSPAPKASGWAAWKAAHPEGAEAAFAAMPVGAKITISTPDGDAEMHVKTVGGWKLADDLAGMATTDAVMAKHVENEAEVGNDVSVSPAAPPVTAKPAAPKASGWAAWAAKQPKAADHAEGLAWAIKGWLDEAPVGSMIGDATGDTYVKITPNHAGEEWKVTESKTKAMIGEVFDSQDIASVKIQVVGASPVGPAPAPAATVAPAAPGAIAHTFDLFDHQIHVEETDDEDGGYTITDLSDPDDVGTHAPSLAAVKAHLDALVGGDFLSLPELASTLSGQEVVPSAAPAPAAPPAPAPVQASPGVAPDAASWAKAGVAPGYHTKKKMGALGKAPANAGKPVEFKAVLLPDGTAGYQITLPEGGAFHFGPDGKAKIPPQVVAPGGSGTFSSASLAAKVLTNGEQNGKTFFGLAPEKSGKLAATVISKGGEAPVAAAPAPVAAQAPPAAAAPPAPPPPGPDVTSAWEQWKGINPKATEAQILGFLNNTVPVGGTLKFNSSILTKTGPSQWMSSKGDEVDASWLASLLEATTPATPVVDLKVIPKAPAALPGWLDSLPEGATVTDNDNDVWLKKPGNLWVLASAAATHPGSPAEVSGLIGFHPFQDVTLPEAAPAPAAATSPAAPAPSGWAAWKAAHPVNAGHNSQTVAWLESAPVGAQVKDSDGDAWTKQGDGVWEAGSELLKPMNAATLAQYEPTPFGSDPAAPAPVAPAATTDYIQTWAEKHPGAGASFYEHEKWLVEAPVDATVADTDGDLFVKKLGGWESLGTKTNGNKSSYGPAGLYVGAATLSAWKPKFHAIAAAPAAPAPSAPKASGWAAWAAKHPGVDGSQGAKVKWLDEAPTGATVFDLDQDVWVKQDNGFWSTAGVKTNGSPGPVFKDYNASEVASYKPSPSPTAPDGLADAPAAAAGSPAATWAAAYPAHATTSALQAWMASAPVGAQAFAGGEVWTKSPSGFWKGASGSSEHTSKVVKKNPVAFAVDPAVAAWAATVTPDVIASTGKQHYITAAQKAPVGAAFKAANGSIYQKTGTVTWTKIAGAKGAKLVGNNLLTSPYGDLKAVPMTAEEAAMLAHGKKSKVAKPSAAGGKTGGATATPGQKATFMASAPVTVASKKKSGWDDWHDKHPGEAASDADKAAWLNDAPPGTAVPLAGGGHAWKSADGKSYVDQNGDPVAAPPASAANAQAIKAAAGTGPDGHKYPPGTKYLWSVTQKTAGPEMHSAVMAAFPGAALDENLGSEKYPLPPNSGNYKLTLPLSLLPAPFANPTTDEEKAATAAHAATVLLPILAKYGYKPANASKVVGHIGGSNAYCNIKGDGSVVISVEKAMTVIQPAAAGSNHELLYDEALFDQGTPWHGHGIDYDSDMIRDQHVSVSKRKGGVKEVRFKMTSWAEAKMNLAAAGHGQWSIGDGSYDPQTGEATKPGTVRKTDATRTFTGPGWVAHYVEKPKPAPGSYASTVDNWAMQHSVKIEVQPGTKVADAMAGFAAAIGVPEMANPPTPESQEHYKLRKMLWNVAPETHNSLFGKDGDVASPPPSSDQLRAALKKAGMTDSVINGAQIENIGTGHRAVRIPDGQKFIDIGVHGLFHNWYSSDAKDMARKIASGGNTATAQRWKTGMGGKGLSSDTDMSTGGGDYVFQYAFRPDKDTYFDGFHSGNGIHIVTGPATLERADWHAAHNDNYGNCGGKGAGDSDNFYNRKGRYQTLIGLKSGKGEVLVQNNTPHDEIKAIVCNTAQKRNDAIAEFKSLGVTHMGGRPIEEVVVTTWDQAGDRVKAAWAETQAQRNT